MISSLSSIKQRFHATTSALYIKNGEELLCAKSTVPPQEKFSFPNLGNINFGSPEEITILLSLHKEIILYAIKYLYCQILFKRKVPMRDAPGPVVHYFKR